MDVDSSDGSDFSDEENDFSSMVLSLLLSGNIGRGESLNNCMASAVQHDEPDTIQNNDFKQILLAKLGKTTSCKSQSIVNALVRREICCYGTSKQHKLSAGACANISSRFLPNKLRNTCKLRHKLFCGTFSEDGDIFISACQDGMIRVYESAHLKSKSVKPFKTISAIDVGWSILDTTSSPDGFYVAYSTWSNNVYLASIYDNDSRNCCHRALNLRPEEDMNFAVFSIKFSACNNEILCGGSDGNLYVYDCLSSQRVLCISGHEDDVNTVCFADKSSHILYSGGDDGLIRVWDRRCLSESHPTSVGVFAGHLDGITFIDSHLDSRYLLSNCKDQSIKLWDLRHFSSNEAQTEVKRIVSLQRWDYRWQQPPQSATDNRKTISGDTSLKTYHGHRVTNTLIRARFSPLHTTGQKYIYCGCSSGNYIIYEVLTGKIVLREKEHRSCVRDISWHPYEQTLVTSSWDNSFGVWDYEPNEKIDKTRENEETGEPEYPCLRRSPRLAKK